ncbi:amidohydrolase family protein [Xanthobacter oligotrophicus]|uniref:amidohydrolase family protein n=1 Tax=Xanthobacter oligotrophicus TaxID=2607286 RepID=UPI001E62E597|nr:amidohydrolase family protein [Xanthobacter oligotrophicus]MCG5236356.1 amidohydrolase family protein [Xanthobacter oligotrophicus]
MGAAAPLCLPPRPVGPLPTVRLLPPGTCDAHMHVFGPVARYPLAVARNYTPHPVPFADYRPVMAALGIDRAVLVQPSVYGTDNSALLDTLRQAPGQLRGVVVVPPSISDGDLAGLHHAGVRGIRVNRRNPGGLALEDLALLGRRIAPLGWHIQLQVEIGQGAPLAPLVESCPVPVVLDHLGLLDPTRPVGDAAFAEVLALLAAGNLWLKLSAPYRVSRMATPYTDLAPFVEALMACRPDRLLWGSDWPHTELWRDMPDDLDPGLRLGFDRVPEAIRQLIFVANPARLYGFEPAEHP